MGSWFEVTPGYMAMLCVMAWIDRSICISFAASVIIHEIGHLLVLKLMGISVRKVQLRLSGARIDSVFLDYRKEILCAAAGPSANLLFAWIILHRWPKIAAISILLATANLLPIYPMDGGRLVRSGLMLMCRPECAAKASYIISFVTAIGLMITACWVTAYLQAGIWPVFAAMALLWRAGDEEKQLLFCDYAARMKKQETIK